MPRCNHFRRLKSPRHACRRLEQRRFTRWANIPTGRTFHVVCLSDSMVAEASFRCIPTFFTHCRAAEIRGSMDKPLEILNLPRKSFSFIFSNIFIPIEFRGRIPFLFLVNTSTNALKNLYYNYLTITDIAIVNRSHSKVQFLRSATTQILQLSLTVERNLGKSQTSTIDVTINYRFIFGKLGG